jgi:hypothetical protein
MLGDLVSYLHFYWVSAPNGNELCGVMGGSGCLSLFSPSQSWLCWVIPMCPTTVPGCWTPEQSPGYVKGLAEQMGGYVICEWGLPWCFDTVPIAQGDMCYYSHFPGEEPEAWLESWFKLRSVWWLQILCPSSWRSFASDKVCEKLLKLQVIW